MENWEKIIRQKEEANRLTREQKKELESRLIEKDVRDIDSVMGRAFQILEIEKSLREITAQAIKVGRLIPSRSRTTHESVSGGTYAISGAPNSGGRSITTHVYTYGLLYIYEGEHNGGAVRIDSAFGLNTDNSNFTRTVDNHEISLASSTGGGYHFWRNWKLPKNALEVSSHDQMANLTGSIRLALAEDIQERKARPVYPFK